MVTVSKQRTGRSTSRTSHAAASHTQSVSGRTTGERSSMYITLPTAANTARNSRCCPRPTHMPRAKRISQMIMHKSPSQPAARMRPPRRRSGPSASCTAPMIPPETIAAASCQS